MMPNVANALKGFGTTLKFQKTEKVTDNFVTKVRDVDAGGFTGVIVPVPAQKLVNKPEGQRDWQWYVLYTPEKLQLGGIIKGPDNKRFAVMSKADWGSYGEYEIAERTV